MAQKKIKPELVEEPKKVAPPAVEDNAPVGPKWIKVTLEELDKIQKAGKLKGYRPSTGEALV